MIELKGKYNGHRELGVALSFFAVVFIQPHWELPVGEQPSVHKDSEVRHYGYAPCHMLSLNAAVCVTCMAYGLACRLPGRLYVPMQVRAVSCHMAGNKAMPQYWKLGFCAVPQDWNGMPPQKGAFTGGLWEHGQCHT